MEHVPGANPPLQGEGDHEVVDGGAESSRETSTPPSTILRMVPLPVPGRTNWHHHLTALATVAIAILALFHRDALDMADKWWNISTYGHCLLIPFIIGWLVWQRKDEVEPLAPAAWWWGLLPLGGAALLWMLGEAGSISLFRHAAVIFMLQSAVLTVLGPTVFRALLFPIFYACFLIPFGEEAVPMMQTITAKMSMIMLGWAGVPATIDGVFITIPTGLFEVAEACSGVKFLVAMAAYSALAANVCFKSWSRRAIFLGVAMIVPIIANGIRAWATIYVSFRTGSTAFASSFDHIIFGWVFFAVVLAIVMGVSWRFFDRKLDEPWLDNLPVRPFKAASLIPTSISALVLIGGIMALQAGLAVSGRTDLPNRISLPQVEGWTITKPYMTYAWQPDFIGADHRLEGQYVNQAGDRVDLVIVLYGWQAEGKEMVGFGQGAFNTAKGWSWANTTSDPQNGRAEHILGPGADREVLSFYTIGGQTTGSDTQVKLETLKARMLGGDQVAAAILVSAEARPNQPSRPQIDHFLANVGSLPELANRMVVTAKGQP